MSIDTLASESLSYGLHELQKILVYPVQNDIKLNDPSRYWVMYGVVIKLAAACCIWAKLTPRLFC